VIRHSAHRGAARVLLTYTAIPRAQIQKQLERTNADLEEHNKVLIDRGEQLGRTAAV
jgi:hypothetical protein